MEFLGINRAGSRSRQGPAREDTRCGTGGLRRVAVKWTMAVGDGWPERAREGGFGTNTDAGEGLIIRRRATLLGDWHFPEATEEC